MFHCECTDGWIIDNCDIPDPCQTHVCENGGTCFHLILTHAIHLVNLPLSNYLDNEIINWPVTAECKWCGKDVDECLVKETWNGHRLCANYKEKYTCFCEHG